MSEQQTTAQAAPAKIRQPRKISPFWLLPIVAFCIGAMLFFQILREQGQMITIRFQEGNGITAGKTAIRYQGLQIGLVKKVYFVDDLKQVQVEAEINSEAKSVLKQNTKFWLVQPSASLAGVSGLDALVSGNYITLIPGDSDAKSETDFIAEDEAPAVTATDGDLLVKLIADDLGSMSVGSNIYYRKVPVGSIADYRFTTDQKKVEIDVVIDKKYANLVKPTSRFWNISGVQFDAGLSGINVTVDSLASIVQGAVAFDSPNDSEGEVLQRTKFQLYPDLKSAKRGIEISIEMPIVSDLRVNETPVFHQNLQIGVLSSLNMPKVAENAENSASTATPMLQGKLLIDPAYENLFRAESRILLKEPKFNLNKEQISKIGELFRGIYFDLSDGLGEPKTHFSVQKETDYMLSRPNTLAIRLSAPQSYGVDVGQGIFVNDVKIGEILKRRLDINKVEFDAIIFPPYRHLVSANSRFAAISQLDVSVGLDGLRVHAASPAEWLQGGVRVIGSGGGEAKRDYPLYKNIDNAEAGIVGNEKKATTTLNATNLEGIDKGSLVLYRQFQVGEVLAVRPKKEGFDVELFIEPTYRHLLTEQSRFWIEPSAAVDISGRGISVQAAPLMRVLKGAISFDQGGAKGNKTLYSSFAKAASGNTYITLIAKDASKLSRGMPIKYLGLTVGEVEKLTLDNAKKQVKVTAYIQGEYYAMIARAGAKFRAVSPEITTSGVKNLDAAIQNYINVETGNGNAQHQFNLSETDTTVTQYHGGFPIILETADADGILPDAPVLYRGMQVGVVHSLGLSELGDRVLISLRIQPKYQHLVRKNSQFWQASGYTMDVSLSGVSMNSGTMTQLFNGGISFSTPSGKVVQAQAAPNQRFLLQRKTPNGAQGWNQGAN